MENLIGKTYGRLEVVSFSHRTTKSSFWVCKCVCGKQKVIDAGNLKRSITKSCGCLHKEVFRRITTKHGLSRTKEYFTWQEIRARCYRETHKLFKDYGGRGIKVCERWNDFENFLHDMGDAPSGHRISIDRVNNDGDYKPSNCRWATSVIQNNNKRTNVFVSVDGVLKTLAQWAIDFGINKQTVYSRIRRGWNYLDSLEIPVKTQ